MKSNQQPKLSVLLPVYNGQKYLKQSIDSVLGQTYTDFELIIIDDGSVDNSSAIIKAYTDPRIVFSSQKNLGLADTLNRAVAKAEGDYLARQDQDDISLPQRFEKQVDFLTRYPEVGLVGTWSQIWVENVKTKRLSTHPTANWEIQLDILFNTPLVHSSVMIRKEVIEKVGAYSTDPTRQPPEDYELWSRILRRYQVANIPEVLHYYRETSGSMSRDGALPFQDKVTKISQENIEYLLKRDPGDRSIQAVSELSHNLSLASLAVKYQDLMAVFDQIEVVFKAMPGVNKNLLHAKLKKRRSTVRYHYLRTLASSLRQRMTRKKKTNL